MEARPRSADCAAPTWPCLSETPRLLYTCHTTTHLQAGRSPPSLPPTQPTFHLPKWASARRSRTWLTRSALAATARRGRTPAPPVPQERPTKVSAPPARVLPAPDLRTRTWEPHTAPRAPRASPGLWPPPAPRWRPAWLARGTGRRGPTAPRRAPTPWACSRPPPPPALPRAPPAAPRPSPRWRTARW